tara:strand:- start:99 stop:398 length:300 start_codon:yes stop_codon:yes gene_type:complete
MARIIFFLCLALSLNASAFTLNAEGKYCQIEGAYTSDGESVYGEFYMYSNDYGEADGAYTDGGDSVSGECYRYSERYCELEGAYTSEGESVFGECYIYD